VAEEQTALRNSFYGAEILPVEKSWNPLDPDFGETVRSSLNELVGGSNVAGNSGYWRGRTADALAGVVDFIPGFGDVAGVGDTRRSLLEGNYVNAGIDATATLLGAVPIVGDLAAKALRATKILEKRGINAWHGTPHRVDKFSMDKIGTGEGVQAYGHGLYFAENPDVAKQYAGNLYNVNLNVNPDSMLDWDVPLADQPKALNAVKEIYLDEIKRINDPLMSEVYQSVDDVDMSVLGLFDKSKGSQAYNTIAKSNFGRGAEELSTRLRAKGIPGIKYLDGTNRKAAEDTRNYVMFDDSNIKIKSALRDLDNWPK
jgi:hypothetical protein